MAYTDFSTTRFHLFAVIDGMVIEVVDCQIDYTLNTIPTCTLSVAIGRDVESLSPSSIHYIIDTLHQQVPAEVWLEVIEPISSLDTKDPVDIWPSEPFIIFDGYVTGTGFQKSRSGGAQLKIELIHWLTDLNFSSAVTRSTTAFNPAQLNLQAAFDFGTGLPPDWQAATAAGNHFDSNTVSRDLWGKALRPWFLEVCKHDLLSVDEGGNAGTNTEAIDALNRFEPFGNKYEFSVPLSMNASGILGIDTAIESIIEDISLETFESMASTTIWDKLIQQIAADYKFSVAPMADRALVIPFTPGRSIPWVVIDTAEYESIMLQSAVPRAIRGLGILTGVGSMTGAIGLQAGNAADIKELGGFYQNPNIENGSQGMVLFRQAPRWIANCVATSPWSVFAAAPNGVKGNAINAGVGVDPPLPEASQIRAMALPLWDAYARALYIAEVLKGRRGTLRGKVRFDICPGSTVGVICTEEKFVEKSAGLTADSIIYGEVLSITTVFNAERPESYTTLQLQYTRSEIENSLEGTGTLNHPLYSTFWNGAPLIGLPEFDTGGS